MVKKNNVMKKVILKFKSAVKHSDLRNLSIINNIEINQKNISQIKIFVNRKESIVGNFFSIEISKIKTETNEIEIHGCNKFCHHLGYRWKKDKLFVNSDVGSNIGYEMISGEIKINGSVDHFLGAQMSGGTIYVMGHAGNFVGSAYLGVKQGMRGGEIIVQGNAGDYLGCFMRRGLIIVKENVGKFCCFKMIAGNVILFKSYKPFLGLSMKRGTIFLMDNNIKNIGAKISKPVDYFESIFFRYFKQYLKNKYSINLGNDKFQRFCLDRSINGIGEILVKQH
ncbi:MAG: formylmethanofuran dehydrogenase subunit C [Rickettsiales bacterium]|nr:formylmethanofuran dehydrogenase subunit C [Rickettsiales bacterium]